MTTHDLVVSGQGFWSFYGAYNGPTEWESVKDLDSWYLIRAGAGGPSTYLWTPSGVIKPNDTVVRLAVQGYLNRIGVAPPVELIQNPGFENGILFPPWILGTSCSILVGGLVGPDPAFAHSGDYCVNLGCRLTGPGCAYLIANVSGLTVGQTYKFSFWWKNSGWASGQNRQCTVLFAGGLSNLSTLNSDQSTWLYSGEFQAIATSTICSIICQTQAPTGGIGTTNYWLDDFSIKGVPDESPAKAVPFYRLRGNDYDLPEWVLSHSGDPTADTGPTLMPEREITGLSVDDILNGGFELGIRATSSSNIVEQFNQMFGKLTVRPYSDSVGLVGRAIRSPFKG